MNGKSKRKFTAQFKLKVVLEVLKEKETLAVISKHHELHPNQISDWKKQFLDGASAVFESTTKSVKLTQEPDNALLYEQIGRLQMELTFLVLKKLLRTWVKPVLLSCYANRHRSAFKPASCSGERLHLYR